MDAGCGAQGAGLQLLRWKRQGAKLALDIAKGLESLHARKVSSVTYACVATHMFIHMYVCECILTYVTYGHK